MCGFTLTLALEVRDASRRESEVFNHAYLHPLPLRERDAYVEVQEGTSCWGFGGVPQSPSLPPGLVARGLKRGRGDSDGGHSPPYVPVVADVAPLYPPYTWIPAFAGMTRQVQQDAAGGLGVSPSSFVLPPRVGDQGG